MRKKRTKHRSRRNDVVAIAVGRSEDPLGRRLQTRNSGGKETREKKTRRREEGKRERQKTIEAYRD